VGVVSTYLHNAVFQLKLVVNIPYIATVGVTVIAKKEIHWTFCSRLPQVTGGRYFCLAIVADT
jgi:hypothetical protein